MLSWRLKGPEPLRNDASQDESSEFEKANKRFRDRFQGNADHVNQ